MISFLTTQRNVHQVPQTAETQQGRGNCSANSVHRPVQKQTQKCIICLDDFPARDMLSAGNGGPSTRSAALGCHHLACRFCIQQYVRQQLAGRKYPLVCPSYGCGKTLQHETLAVLLAGHSRDLQVLEQLQEESAIPPSQRLYCPYNTCSALMKKSNRHRRDEPATCSQCSQSFCPTCLLPGWHEGYSCAAFQQLPPHQRSVEDAQMLRLVDQNHWKHCPACSIVVERTQGCNHMQCRCGASFCYACGQKYANKTPQPGNPYGLAACTCG